MKKITCIFAFLVLSGLFLQSQNETSKWYFGNMAGLDFMTNPPTILTNGAMNTNEGCASIADANGNLLFYSDGATVWNQQHQIMANGTGLLGNGPTGTSQAALVVKKPNSNNVYFLFTLDDASGPNGLTYSAIDLSLAAGMGSVTSKNFFLHSPLTEQLTAVKHCNGQDVWVITHEWNSNNFRSYLVTSAGVNTVAVISSVGPTFTATNVFPFTNDVSPAGCIKSTADGRRLGLSVLTANSTAGGYQLYDFNTSTGVVTNSLNLLNCTWAYPLEFSSDGTKFYARGLDANSNSLIYQWDLCAGSNAAIVASKYTVIVTPDYISTMQLAKNDKLYLAAVGKPYLDAINSPNNSGALCNYSQQAQSIGNATCNLGLPNFVSSYFKPTNSSQPFLYNYNAGAATCLTPTFTAISCPYTSQPVNSVLWSFGHPASGAANTSTVLNPTHTYNAPGTYTVQLIINYNCSSDTLKQTITLNNYAPALILTGKKTICIGESSTLFAGGANTYSWNHGINTASTIVSPTVTTTYTVVGTSTSACTTITAITVTVS